MLPGSAPEPRRPRCPRCGLPLATCLCRWIVPVDHRVEVLVLQHPMEARSAKGSVRLLALSLARCRVVVGETFDATELGTWLRAEGRRSVLLYPEAPALGNAPPDPRAGEPVDQLVVIDATWRKSLAMVLKHPALRALPRLSLSDAPPGRYGALRKAPRAGQLATLEATCAALSVLEIGGFDAAPLLAAFGQFVDDRVARVRGAQAPG